MGNRARECVNVLAALDEVDDFVLTMSSGLVLVPLAHSACAEMLSRF